VERVVIVIGVAVASHHADKRATLVATLIISTFRVSNTACRLTAVGIKIFRETVIIVIVRSTRLLQRRRACVIATLPYGLSLRTREMQNFPDATAITLNI
jgi:hypothetical protein